MPSLGSCFRLFSLQHGLGEPRRGVWVSPELGPALGRAAGVGAAWFLSCAAGERGEAVREAAVVTCSGHPGEGQAEGAPHRGLQLPPKGQRRSVPSVTSDRVRGNGWSRAGGIWWLLGEGFSARRQSGTEQIPQALFGHSPKPGSVQEALGTRCQGWGGLLGCPVQSLELSFVCLFQLGIFCRSGGFAHQAPSREGGHPSPFGFRVYRLVFPV